MQSNAYFEREAEYQVLRGFLKNTQQETRIARLMAEAIRDELTERQAEQVRMYYLEQRTMREIAAILGVNPSTVSRTLAIARKKLRRCLKFSSKALLRRDDPFEDFP